MDYPFNAEESAEAEESTGRRWGDSYNGMEIQVLASTASSDGSGRHIFVGRKRHSER
jgi:hypothetical protein